jgi:hypothetical protein
MGTKRANEKAEEHDMKRTWIRSVFIPTVLIFAGGILMV